MKIAVIIITDDHETLQYIGQRKAAIIPTEIRKMPVRFNVVTMVADEDFTKLCSQIIIIHKNHDCVGMFIELSCTNKFNFSEDAVFVRKFNSVTAKGSYNNYFSHQLNRWLKNLIFLCESFSDGKKQKCLLLPLANFSASEMPKISKLVSDCNNLGLFIGKLEILISGIRARNTPKSFKSDKRQFLKDDIGRLFELGKENHGQAETSNPPHDENCILTAYARFGVSIDRQLHYNISLNKQRISGKFPDCHNDLINVPLTTHINMFPNGSIR